MRLETADGSRSMTCNVEYNQLEPLLLASEAFSGGDIAGPDGVHSVFPGNMNQLVFNLSSYVETLASNGGAVPEFVNPKYADPEKRDAFKKATRLECMMQDITRDFPGSSKVGFTEIVPGPLNISFYSPVKNKKGAKYTPASSELQIKTSYKQLLHIGVAIQRMQAREQSHTRGGGGGGGGGG